MTKTKTEIKNWELHFFVDRVSSPINQVKSETCTKNSPYLSVILIGTDTISSL